MAVPQELVTKPALRTGDPDEGCFPATLRLTIVFHPDLQRIGRWADLCAWEAERSDLILDELQLGRYFPKFSDQRSLEDSYVSRLACLLHPKRSRHPDGNLSLRIQAAAHADVRIGAARHKGVIADHDALVAGVPLRLSHGVVLVLRLIASGERDPAVSHAVLQQSLPGASWEMQQLWHQIALVAPTNLPILVQGESGVGKERVAQAIHALSARSSQPLAAINLAAIPQDLAAAELFGSVRGAYTGAIDRLGAFQRAHKGTLFLDEIADAPMAVQVQLLRALEQGRLLFFDYFRPHKHWA